MKVFERQPTRNIDYSQPYDDLGAWYHAICDGLDSTFTNVSISAPWLQQCERDSHEPEGEEDRAEHAADGGPGRADQHADPHQPGRSHREQPTS